MIRVTVWNEFYHETISEEIRAIYPQGIHQAIADFLGKNEDMTVRTVVMDDPENGLTDEILESTDVLLWWSHVCHEKVSDLVAEKVKNRVLKGMGFIPLHSSHMCKPFRLLMGTGCTLKWREGDKERLWCCNPGHPIAEGIPESFTLEPEEMYGEHFDIHTPDDVIYISWFKWGEVIRSGCTFTRGYGKIFYFRPGHESYPTFYNENVQKVLTNAVRWAQPRNKRTAIDCPFVQPAEQ